MIRHRDMRSFQRFKIMHHTAEKFREVFFVIFSHKILSRIIIKVAEQQPAVLSGSVVE